MAPTVMARVREAQEELLPPWDGCGGKPGMQRRARGISPVPIWEAEGLSYFGVPKCCAITFNQSDLVAKLSVFSPDPQE